jgi:hypothetical protein
MNDITITTKDGATYKPSKKNDLFMEYWTSPNSETFGNVFKSGLKAGFSKSYAKNLLNVAPKWLSTYIDRTNFTNDHIKLALQQLASAAPNSRSPDDTRLKSLEILAKVQGLIDNKHSTTNVIVQPILSGLSANPAQAKQVLNSRVTIETDDTTTDLID